MLPKDNLARRLRTRNLQQTEVVFRPLLLCRLLLLFLQLGDVGIKLLDPGIKVLDALMKPATILAIRYPSDGRPATHVHVDSREKVAKAELVFLFGEDENAQQTELIQSPVGAGAKQGGSQSTTKSSPRPLKAKWGQLQVNGPRSREANPPSRLMKRPPVSAPARAVAPKPSECGCNCCFRDNPACDRTGSTSNCRTPEQKQA